MGKFARQISRQGAIPTKNLSLPAPAFIPLHELDKWFEIICNKGLSRDDTIRLYWQVGIHSFVVNKLLETLQANKSEAEIIELMRELYKESCAELTQSIVKNGGVKTQPSFRN